MRIRDCPAAVCRNDRRHTALVLGAIWDWEATASRCIFSVRARESEDLPAVPGAPRPAAHRLVERAFGQPAEVVRGFQRTARLIGCASAGGDHTVE